MIGIPRYFLVRHEPSIVDKWICEACFLILAAGIWFRVVHLSWIPGLNGDEAWYGVTAQNIISGRPFSFWTPTGNPLDPFMMLPAVLLSYIAPPSILALRSVTVLGGIITVFLSYACIKNITKSHRAGLIAAAFVGAMPIAIAYSRFAWSPSFSIGIGIAFLWACYKSSKIIITLFFAAALVIHPTNIFLLPAAYVYAFFREQKFLNSIARISPCLIVFGALRLISPGVSSVGGGLVNIDRIFHYQNWQDILIGYADLILGKTAFEYIEGGISHGWLVFYHLCLTPTFYLAIISLFVLAARAKDFEFLTSFTALAGTIFLILISVGMYVLTPGYERYGLFSIPPLVLFVGISAARSRIFSVFVLVISTVLLFGFNQNYIEPFVQSGGNSHRTFRTAVEEPKLSAFNTVFNMRHHFHHIAVDDYWLEYLFLYFGSENLIRKSFSA